MALDHLATVGIVIASVLSLFLITSSIFMNVNAPSVTVSKLSSYLLPLLTLFVGYNCFSGINKHGGTMSLHQLQSMMIAIMIAVAQQLMDILNKLYSPTTNRFKTMKNLLHSMNQSSKGRRTMVSTWPTTNISLISSSLMDTRAPNSMKASLPSHLQMIGPICLDPCSKITKLEDKRQSIRWTKPLLQSSGSVKVLVSSLPSCLINHISPERTMLPARIILRTWPQS